MSQKAKTPVKAKAKASASPYASKFGIIVSAKTVASCNSHVHKVEFPDGKLSTLWSDDSLIPIGTRVCVDYRESDGKSFL